MALQRSKMADYLSRACRLQLTTAMENLIRTAVFEISQIFEDSLHDHQMELARKGEEIAYLKVKLQRAELRLKEVSTSSEPDLSLMPSSETPRASEDPAPLDSSTVPEIDYEVPEDWCVPLGSDNVNKQENTCPSVRLRQFSIPLFPIPLKHEAFSKLHVSKLRPRHNQNSAQTGSQEETKPKRKRGRPRQSESNNVRNVLMNIKKESFDIQVKPLTLKLRTKVKGHEIQKLKKTNINETPANTSGKVFRCRFCPKVFDTQFGLSVHERAHKKCKGCKRIFSFPSVLTQHKMKCRLYKKLMKSNVSPEESVSKETSSSIKENKSSVQIKSPVRRLTHFTCKSCQKKFNSRAQLIQHPCFISCQMCHKRISNQMALAAHIAKMHRSPGHFRSKKEDMSWTTPLDEIENSQNDLAPTEKAKAKGKVKQCSQGYKCLTCKKVYLSKYTALDHTFVHTGERPFKCAFCSQTFANRNALSVHRKKRHGFVMKKHIKCACSKSFFTTSRYKEHKLICPKAGK